MTKILFYDKKRFAEITDEEAETIKNAKGTHLDFRGNYLKNNQIEIFGIEEKVEVEIWKKSTEELKEIIGDFENQLKFHKDNIPPTQEGKTRAVNDGKLPDCGMSWLEDRGIMLWYLENGWLWTGKKEGEKRRWSITQKYINDGVSAIEEALEELRHRRIYAEEEAIKYGDKIISDMYFKERQEKIDAMRKKLQIKLGWGGTGVE